MNSKPMLFECLNCKETYLADSLCDGYGCPKCNGHIVARGFIKELEEHIKSMQDKINIAKENGLIRKYQKKSSLGYAIKKLRKERNTTQTDLAISIDRSLRAVQSYEANTIEPPLSVINNIAKALDIPLNELIKQIDLDVVNTKEIKNQTLSVVDLGEGYEQEITSSHKER